MIEEQKIKELLEIGIREIDGHLLASLILIQGKHYDSAVFLINACIDINRSLMMAYGIDQKATTQGKND